MGLRVNFKDQTYGQKHPEYASVVSENGRSERAVVEITDGHWNAPWPEITINAQQKFKPPRDFGRGQFFAGNDGMDVEIHGVTVGHLMDALFENAETRKYLLGAAAYIQETGELKDGTSVDKKPRHHGFEDRYAIPPKEWAEDMEKLGEMVI